MTGLLASTANWLRDLRREWVLASVFVGLGALRLWLGTGLAIYAIAASSHDDSLFLTLARHLADGNWLGPYDRLTLAKGPLYPLWIALNVRLGVPILPAQQALYVAACAALTWAIGPAVERRWGRLVLFAALLFQPASFAGGLVGRMVREGLYPSLTLLLLAAAGGTALRLSTLRRALLGGTVTGLALAALWLTREEGPWILPTLGLIGIAPWLWSRSRPVLMRCATAVMACGVTFAAGWCVVATLNAHHYGSFATNDLSSGAFPRAYGALTRVNHRARRPFVPVPIDVRQQLYLRSPSFSRLAPFLEGDLYAMWVGGSSCPVIGICDDYAGGWFSWALRDAAQLAGQTESAATFSRFWSDVATEINLACDAKLLDCGPPRSSGLEPWQPEYLGPFGSAVIMSLRMVAWPSGMAANVGPGPLRSALGPYGLLMGQRFAAPGDNDLRLRLLDWVAWAWPPLHLLGVLLGLAAFVVAALRALRQLIAPAPAWWLALACLGAVVARAGVLAYIDATSFPAVNSLYLEPAYPLAVAFSVLAIWNLRAKA